MHYFVDLNPLAGLIFKILKPDGKLVLHEYHPINKKCQIDSDGDEWRLSGDYFSSEVVEGLVPYDWLPPYIVDVADDGDGPESELVGRAPVRGGGQLGVIGFVDGNGVAVGPVPGCTSSYIFNYYGSGGPEVDPACHPGATAVQSYRHSHYGKNHLGANIDAEWRQGYVRVRVDGNVMLLTEVPALEWHIRHDVDVVVDRLAIKSETPD